MAKGSFALGRFRGKAGGFVFRTDPEVGQIMSVMPEKVSNPRTMAQTRQRAKMNMAGQLSKMTPYEAIAGMGFSRRNARSMFVKKVLLNTRIEPGTEPGEIKAAILWNKLVLSEGLVTYPTCTVTLDQSTPKVTIAANLANLGATPVGAIAVGYLANGSVMKGCFVAMSNGVNSNNVATMEITLPGDLGDYDDQTPLMLYVVPIFETNGNVAVAYDVLVNGNGGTAAAYAVRTIAANGGYAHSIYLGPTVWE